MFSFIAHMDGCVWVVIANENVIRSCKGRKILHAPRQNFDSKIMLHLSEGLSIFFPGYGKTHGATCVFRKYVNWYLVKCFYCALFK